MWLGLLSRPLAVRLVQIMADISRRSQAVQMKTPASDMTVYRCGQAAAMADNLHLDGDKYWSNVAAVVLKRIPAGMRRR